MSKYTLISFATAGLLTVACASEALVLETPTANLTEKWTNSSGWGATSRNQNVSFGWSNGVMLAAFADLGEIAIPDPSVIKIYGATNSSGGRFCGSYTNIESVVCDINAVGLTQAPYFYFKTANRQWRWYLNVIGTSFSQIGYTIPLTYSPDWSSIDGCTNPVAFQMDKSSVKEIGFIASRSQNNSQLFTVDNLKLIGPWGQPLIDGFLPLAWVIENGLTNDLASVATDDNDHDGFSNQKEFLAGTDPLDSNSVFRVELGRNANGKMTAKWRGNRYMNYDLLQATTLVNGGDFNVITNVVPSAVKTEEIPVEDNGGGARFYKVRINQNK